MGLGCVLGLGFWLGWGWCWVRVELGVGVRVRVGVRVGIGVRVRITQRYLCNTVLHYYVLHKYPRVRVRVGLG